MSRFHLCDMMCGQRRSGTRRSRLRDGKAAKEADKKAHTSAEAWLKRLSTFAPATGRRLGKKQPISAWKSKHIRLPGPASFYKSGAERNPTLAGAALGRA
jgi:hypothetical protein